MKVATGRKTDLAVSVVVPTKGRDDLLMRCLDSLALQDMPLEEYEVLVVDDGHDDRTKDAVERWMEISPPMKVRYMRPDGEGPASARNSGWKAASAPLIAFTDDDCIPARSWLRMGLSAFNDGVVAASGRTVVPVPMNPTDYEADAARLTRATFITANCFVKRESLEAVGGLDQRYPTEWREDSDLYFRLLKLDKPIVRVEEATVIHPISPGKWGASIGHQKRCLYNALLYREHPELYKIHIQPGPPWRYYVMVSLVSLSLASAIRRRSAASAAFGSAWAALVSSFAAERLKGTTHAPSHVLEIFVTSIVIPPLAIFYRIKGAIRYKVVFL